MKYCRKYWSYNEIFIGQALVSKVWDVCTSGGCFITTSACVALKKPEDCYELNKFRIFRDDWLKNQYDGEDLINEYYRIAPQIVKNINLKKDKTQIYEYIWQKYLDNCLVNIENCNYDECKKIYIKMVNQLKNKYHD